MSAVTAAQNGVAADVPPTGCSAGCVGSCWLGPNTSQPVRISALAETSGVRRCDDEGTPGPACQLACVVYLHTPPPPPQVSAGSPHALSWKYVLPCPMNTVVPPTDVNPSGQVSELMLSSVLPLGSCCG